MNKALELALTGLIPTLDGPLPPELIELSSSLLAQSRTKVSSLKAEEETARALKGTLNLPKIEPRPPCPPRIYQKLYKYFEATLLPPQPRRRPPNTPTKNTIATTATPARQSPRTPSKQQQQQSRQKPTPRKSSLIPKKATAAKEPTKPIIPLWVSPSIDRLCTKLLAPAAIPHVLEGVTAILTQPSPFLSNAKNAPLEDKRDKIPALVIAVYFFVTTRLSNQETTGSEYVHQREAAMAVMEADPEFLENNEPFGTKDVDAWLKEISDRGWLRLDWFDDVPEDTGLSLGMEEAAEPRSAAEGSIPTKNPSHTSPSKRPSRLPPARDILNNNNTLQVGLGTMMQDRVDYLSEEKRLDFLDWKEEIMTRVDALEQQHEPPEDTMDTSAG
ncbi:MAG: hypothetical protein M1813_004876 [Trichoglossum hirsutum]|nr:MAG: hypothetical protein M1813_004876 [Trichoglossum hirsutum]